MTNYNVHNKSPRHSFANFGVWKEGHKLVLLIYKLTKKFPKEELFALVPQMRRAAVSVTSNIAEGYGRSSQKDKIHFYFIARGSLTELENQTLISKDIGYISEGEFGETYEKILEVSRLLNSFIKNARSYVAS